MKRININEIIINKVYYAVCCGNVSMVIIKDINPPKALVYYLSNDLEQVEFLSDIGIEYPNESYINTLNRLFKSSIDADKFISSRNYQKNLKQHQLFTW